MCTVILLPGDNPIAINTHTHTHTYIYIVQVANLSGCIDFVEESVAIAHASLPVHPSARAIGLLQMLPFQSFIYHRRYIISAPGSILNCDALIVTRLRARQSRSRCGIPGKSNRMPSSPQRSVLFWGSASLPTKV